MNRIAFQVEIACRKTGLRSGQGALRRRANRALHTAGHDLGLGGCMMSVLFTSDEVVRGLNLEFRGIDEPTDILSFPALVPLPKKLAVGTHLGDLAIALPYTKRQAAALGRPFFEEVDLLLVHGLLHLIGWDHDTKAREKAMWREQDRLLALLAGGRA